MGGKRCLGAVFGIEIKYKVSGKCSHNQSHSHPHIPTNPHPFTGPYTADDADGVAGGAIPQ